MKKKRNRLKQVASLETRLSAQAAALRKQAAELPAGRKRDELLQKAEQDEVAIEMVALLKATTQELVRRK
jgi:hypothetical protein